VCSDSLLPAPCSLQHRLERPPHGFGHDRLASCRGVDAVGLVQGIDPRDTVEQKRDQLGIVLPGHIAVDGPKPPRICPPQIRRCLHPQNDHRGWRTLAAGPVEDGLEVGFELCGILAAETVIGTGFDDQQRDRLSEDPIDAPDGPGRGLAA